MRGSIGNKYAGCRVNEKNKILFDQTKFCTRIHTAKLGNEINISQCSARIYICNICRVARIVEIKNYLTKPKENWHACSCYEIKIGG